MASSSNRFGLSRYIPADIKRDIRRRSKFGCVCCRSVIYQYEHIVPTFADAKEHDPGRICLLCGSCHDRVTRGRLSKETIQAEYEKVQFSKEVQRPFEEFDFGAGSIVVELGTARFENSQCLIRVNGTDLLAIRQPEEPGAFPSLSGVFCDISGNEIFRIEENVWEGPIDAWDIELVGRTVKVSIGPDTCALEIEVKPPTTVIIKQLNMYVDNCHIICDSNEIKIGQVAAGGQAVYIGLKDFTCKGASVGIAVDSCTTTPPIFQGVKIVGGDGIILPGTGLRVGADSASMLIADLKCWQMS